MPGTETTSDLFAPSESSCATPYEMHGNYSSDDESSAIWDQDQDQDRQSLIGPAHSCSFGRQSAHYSTALRPPSRSSSSRRHMTCSALQALLVVSAAVVLIKNNGSSNQADSHAYQSQQRRSFVCITGQLSRLEMQNKIATVLEPLRRAGLPPDVALVVDDSISFTTNDQRIDADYHPAFHALADVVEELRSYDYSVLTEEPYHQPADVIVPPLYLQYLQKRASFDANKTAERAANNIRMIESWSQCYAEMSRDVERMAAYDLVIRIREDAGFLSALDVGRVLQDLHDDPLALLNNGCRAWYNGVAMNDKFGITSPESARAYFQLPYHNLYAAPITPHMKNTETYFYQSYTQAGYHVTRSPYIRDVVKLVSRPDDGVTMLFHQERKKLAKNCQIAVEDDIVPGACTFHWDEKKGKMTVDADVCWQSHVLPGENDDGQER